MHNFANDLHVCHCIFHGGSASEGHQYLVLTPAHQAASVRLKLPEQLTVRESIQAQGSWQVQNCSWWLHRSCLRWSLLLVQRVTGHIALGALNLWRWKYLQCSKMSRLLRTQPQEEALYSLLLRVKCNMQAD